MSEYVPRFDGFAEEVANAGGVGEKVVVGDSSPVGLGTFHHHHVIMQSKHGSKHEWRQLETAPGELRVTILTSDTPRE
jgi:hypothetical protein